MQKSPIIKMRVFITFFHVFFILNASINNLLYLLFENIKGPPAAGCPYSGVGACATCSHCCGCESGSFITHHHLSLLPSFPVFALDTLCTLKPSSKATTSDLKATFLVVLLLSHKFQHNRQPANSCGSEG